MSGCLAKRKSGAVAATAFATLHVALATTTCCKSCNMQSPKLVAARGRSTSPAPCCILFVNLIYNSVLASSLCPMWLPQRNLGTPNTLDFSEYSPRLAPDGMLMLMVNVPLAVAVTVDVEVGVAQTAANCFIMALQYISLPFVIYLWALAAQWYRVW